MRAVHIACVQAIALYGSELRWNPQEGSRRDDQQLLLNRHARSTMVPLPTTLTSALMRDSGHRPVAVDLDTRDQRFVARLECTCEGSKLNELYNFPIPAELIARIAAIEHACSRGAEMMYWPEPGEMPAVKTTILQDDTAAQSPDAQYARQMESMGATGIWMWRSARSLTDDGSVGAAMVCLYWHGWTIFCSYLGTG